MTTQSNLHPNRLLASLASADLALLQSHLTEESFAQRTVLHEVGTRITKVYFPRDGIISLVVPLQEGDVIEAAMIGRDSVVGAATALDGMVALNTAIVQIEGTFSILPTEQLRKATDASASLRATLARHEQALFVQAQQSGACNGYHTVEARLARWMLRSRDLVGSDTLNFTQEFLAQMLGVRRTSVSLVANTLQQAGMIDYRRGRIKITDIDRLREAACECYENVKRHSDRLLNGNSGIQDEREV